jgi:SAM-dependent methyltransferase
MNPKLCSLLEKMPLPAVGKGRFCRVVYSEQLDKLLEAFYGRKGLCLKIARFAGDVLEGAPLTAVVKLQNVAAMHGLAPRVYDIVKVGGMAAQVTDFMPPKQEPTLEGVARLVNFLLEAPARTEKRVGPEGASKWDIVTSNSNWGGDVFLDWGGLVLGNPEQYADQLRDRVAVNITAAHRGEGVEHTYQALPELNLSGSRNFAERVKAIQLHKLDFNGKDVLDLGCNLGEFCFYASRRGARRVVGVDMPFLAKPMREVANWLGYWNVDFAGAQLPDERIATDVERFDIVFALSVCNHVGGYAGWIADLCRDTLVLEGHGGDDPARYTADLQRDFKRVDLIGYTTDVYRRPVFVCRKDAN